MALLSLPDARSFDKHIFLKKVTKSNVLVHLIHYKLLLYIKIYVYENNKMIDTVDQSSNFMCPNAT